MVVLTHANAAREQLGREYGATAKQRRNILQNILRQVRRVWRDHALSGGAE
jgi:hypothetical protein